MGGRSKSSTATTVDNSTNTNDLSGNTGTAIAGVTNSTVTVTSTDHGAIDAAFDFGNNALGFADNTSARMQETSLEAMTQVRNLADKQAAGSLQTINKIGELAESFRSDGASRDQANTRLLIAGGVLIAGVVVVAVVIATRSKK